MDVQVILSLAGVLAAVFGVIIVAIDRFVQRTRRGSSTESKEIGNSLAFVVGERFDMRTKARFEFWERLLFAGAVVISTAGLASFSLVTTRLGAEFILLPIVAAIVAVAVLLAAFRIRVLRR